MAIKKQAVMAEGKIPTIQKISTVALPGLTGKKCEIGDPRGSCEGMKFYLIMSDVPGCNLIACESCGEAVSAFFGVPSTEWREK